MNREEFTDVFSQNISITGGKSRVYSMLVYSGSDSESLVPSPVNRNLLTVPVGNGFRISLSRNEKRLSDFSSSIESKNVRATRRAFSGILKSARNLGFKLCDLTLNKGENEIVTVRNDPVIAEETYEKYSEDANIWPTYLGFTNGSSAVTFDVGMKISCADYVRESGYLIFDAISLILEDLKIYQNLQNAFQPKKSDDELPIMDPVRIAAHFDDAAQLVNYLDVFFSGELDISVTENGSADFSSPDGTWGEIVLVDSGIEIYFKSSVDFGLGVRILDILEPEVKND